MTLPRTPAQVEGVAHLTRHPRALLWAGCGLGKSRMVLESIMNSGGVMRNNDTLIVSPKRVSKLSWPEEIRRWAPHLPFADVSTQQGKVMLKNRSAAIYLCHYDVLQQFVKYGKELGWKPSTLPFKTIVFDELTKAKNPQSKRIKAIRPIADAVDRVWGLTGTPAPNGLLDVWGQVRVVDRGERLGRTFYQFRQRYFYPEDYRQYKWIPHRHTEDEIYGKLSDIALVMRTSEWLDMPDLDVIDHDVTLGRDERRDYDRLKKDSLIAYGNREVTGVTAAVLINKLLQFTGGAVYSDDGETIGTSTAKTSALRNLFGSAVTSNALVLVAYKHHYAAALAECPTGSEMFDGTTSQLDRWNAGKIPALVANPASVGHGLNLQRGGQDVVWFDLTWSQELYEQTNARLWRQGQSGAVRVHRLLVTDSVDDRVAEVLRRKDAGQSALLAAVEML